MKELVLSLVISSLTIVAGYVVVKNTDVDILKYFKTKEKSKEELSKLKKQKEISDESINQNKNDLDDPEVTKKRISKTVKSFFKKVTKKNNNKITENKSSRKITSVPGFKKGKLLRNRKKGIESDNEIEKEKRRKVKEEILKEVGSKKTKKEKINVTTLNKKTNKEENSSSNQEKLEKSSTNNLKRKKIKYQDLEPSLTKVSDLSVSEIDLEDIEIDINDEKTQKDLDRNGDKIIYSCKFTSENREPGMLESGGCEDIGDVNFYFDNDNGKLTWILNEPGSMISGVYNFSIEGTDGKNKDAVSFKITIEDGNSSEPENNTNSVKDSALAGGNLLNNKKGNN